MKYIDLLKKKLHLIILTIVMFSLTGCPQPIDNINNPNENNSSEQTTISSLAETPYNLQVTEDGNNNVLITWEGNVNDCSYAIGVTSIEILPTSIHDFDSIYFCSSLSTHINILYNTSYYFWVIPTAIQDNDETKITTTNLNFSSSVYYYKENSSDEEESPSQFINIAVFLDKNEESNILQTDDIACSSTSLNITPKESFSGQLKYNYRIDNGDWSEDYYLYYDSNNYLFNSYSEQYYGQIDVRAKLNDGDYYDVISFTNKEPEELQSISFNDNDGNPVVYRETPYSQKLTISALKPNSYDNTGTYYYSINNEDWLEFSDSINNIHEFIYEANTELEISSLRIMYMISDIYKSKIYTFKDTYDRDLYCAIDTKPPTHINEEVIEDPYSFSIHWEKPNDDDLNSIAIYYKSHNASNYVLYKEYTTDNIIPLQKTEYISTDKEYIDVKITYTDKAGNSSYYSKDNIEIIRNLSHLCVTPNGTGIGGSWETASDLQTAIEFASTYGIPEVWVQKGTYEPKTAPNATSNNYYTSLYSFSLRNNVRVIGGFTGNETSVPNDFSFEDDQTILIPYDSLFPNYYNGFHILYHPEGTGLDDTAILERVTLKNGLANQPYQNADMTYIVGTHGGAVYNKFSSPTFINCKFENNTASVAGGAVYQVFSHSKYINCIFKDNEVTDSTQTYDTGDLNLSPKNGGGAIYSWNSKVDLVNCIFDNNSASRFGAAVYLDAVSTISSINSTFLNTNSYSNSNADLGIIYMFSISDEYENNTFYNTYFDFTKLIFSNAYNSYDKSQFYTKNNCTNDENQTINQGNNSYLPVDEYDIDHDGNTTELLPVDLSNNSRINNSLVDIGCYESTN